MSFKKIFFKSISTFAIYSYVSQGFDFISTIVLSRLLLPEEYGFFALINIPVGFVNLFANLGIREFIIRSDFDNRFLRKVTGFAFLVGLFLAIFLISISYPIALFFNNPALVLPIVFMSARYIIDSFNYVPSSILNRDLKFDILGRGRILMSGFQILLTILLAYLGFSYWALVIPITISPFVYNLYLRNKVEIRFKLYGWKANLEVFKEIRSLIGILYMKSFVDYWTNSADKLVIGKIFTLSELGLYNRAYRFMGISSGLITGIFRVVLFPSLKQLMLVNGNVCKEYFDIARIILLLNMPLIAIFILLPESLVFLLWGKDWMGVAVFVPYVGILLIFHSIISTMKSLYLLYRKEKTHLYITVVISLSTIALVIVAATISVVHVIMFLSLGMIFITVPMHIYYGYYKSFGFGFAQIARFWLPTIILGSGLFLSVYFNHLFFKIFLLTFFTGILAFQIRRTIVSFIKVLRENLKNVMSKNDLP